MRELIKDGVITQDEGREILFSNEEVGERDKKSLESEIKFLRELVEKLSNQKSIVETIKIIEKPYRQYPWYEPYYFWSGGICNFTTTTTNNKDMVYCASGTTALNTNNAFSLTTAGGTNPSIANGFIGSSTIKSAGNFSSIKTF